jgi:hypothetical protein
MVGASVKSTATTKSLSYAGPSHATNGLSRLWYTGWYFDRRGARFKPSGHLLRYPFRLFIHTALPDNGGSPPVPAESLHDNYVAIECPAEFSLPEIDVRGGCG